MKEQVHEVISERMKAKKFILDHVAEHSDRLIVPNELFRKYRFKVFRRNILDDRILYDILRIVKIGEFVLKGRGEAEECYRQHKGQ